MIGRPRNTQWENTEVYEKVVSRTFYPPLRVYDKFSQGWTGEK